MAKLVDRAACIIFCKKGNLVYTPLVKYSFKDIYDIPRGGFDKDKDKNLIQTAKREIYEELSLDITSNKLYKVGEYEEWHRNRKSGVMLHYVIHSFVTSYPHLQKLKPKDSNEISFAKWIEYSNAIRYLYDCKNFPPIKQLYLAYLVALRYKLI